MKKTFYALNLIGFILLTSCGKKATVDPVITLVGDETLQTASSIPIGCSVSPNLLKSNNLYSGVVIREYGSVTAENAMKWGGLHPSQTTFNFTDADYIADFCATNKKRLFGHTLAWHSNNPTWLETFPGDSTAFENLLKTHIQTVVGRYKGKAVAWDVVNEAFDDNGNLRGESIWAKKLGKDYIARAFKYANEADPAAVLFYNDYGQESSSNKLNAIVAMAKDLKKRGIPIHGLGLQMHISLNSNENGILTALSEYAKTGLKIHVSELDINVSNGVKNPALTLTDTLKAEQRQKYKNIARFYKGIVPVEQQFGITTWNVGDADSWLRQQIQKNEYPLLFDEKYEKKPAFFGFVEGLKGVK